MMRDDIARGRDAKEQTQVRTLEPYMEGPRYDCIKNRVLSRQ